MSRSCHSSDSAATHFIERQPSSTCSVGATPCSSAQAPASGEVVATNGALDSTPELVNSDPYEAGWLFEVKVADASQVDGLMDAAAYESSVAG